MKDIHNEDDIQVNMTRVTIYNHNEDWNLIEFDDSDIEFLKGGREDDQSNC